MTSSAPSRVLLAGALVTLAAAGGIGFTPAADATPGSALGCSQRVLARPAPARTVRATTPAAYRAARGVNAADPGFAAAAAHDPSLWLDVCGHAYYVEEKGSGATASAATTPVTATVPLADTFTLQSRPGSNRTIYLDFTGATVTGTAWNGSYGSTITASPYSADTTVDTNFSDAELTQIQRAWQEVSEDYAPFDVNVTLADPGSDAIDRSSSTDQVYGTRVIVTANGTTATGSVQASCTCGGIAYVNVFNTAGTNHGYYQPAWVFTNGVGSSGKTVGEAAAHEAGHTFGLHHDGTSTSGYYSGSTPWAPIMGASYYQPVTQWSTGEYPDANNTQDDLSIIATGAPRVADDYGDSAATATPVANGGELNGTIGTRTDVDAFSFTAAGSTQLSVTPGPGQPNLDVLLRITDASGSTVATVNPTVAKVNSGSATGLDAVWSVTLPSTAATYYAYVDGTGYGDPAVAGGYSDYDSLGYYRLTLSTATAATPLAVTATSIPHATVGSGYSASPVLVDGGSAPYAYGATGLPAGLSIDPASGIVSGTPTTAGNTVATVTVTDASGTTASAAISLQVEPAPAITVTATDLSGSAVVGTPYSATLAANGGSGSYSWSLVSGTLPSGLALSSSGTISGTPTSAGTSTATVSASSGGSTGTATVTISVVAQSLAFSTSAALPNAPLKQAYGTTIVVTGGAAPYAWKVASGSLPPGLSWTATNGGSGATVSGRATKRGTYNVTFAVTDSAGASVTRTFSIQVR